MNKYSFLEKIEELFRVEEDCYHTILEFNIAKLFRIGDFSHKQDKAKAIVSKFCKKSTLNL